MKIVSNTTAIILAGGRSSRMGQDKGLMNLGDKPMIQYTIDTVSRITSNILIVANDSAYEQFGFPVLYDKVENKGPLAGIIGGLSATLTEHNWILACDTPYVTAELLLELMAKLKDYDAVVSMHQDKVHPLIATYNRRVLPVFEKQLKLNNLKLMRANAELNVEIFNADHYDLINFKNLNSKTDL